MTSGDKIRKIRELKGLSRKELANWCGMSEFTLRNYELGVSRIPHKQLEILAAKLGVNINALSNPTDNSLLSFAHILFDFEDEYELVPLSIEVDKNGEIEELYVCLKISDEINEDEGYSSMLAYFFLSEWNDMRERLTKGEITREEYNEWRYGYSGLREWKKKDEV